MSVQGGGWEGARLLPSPLPLQLLCILQLADFSVFSFSFLVAQRWMSDLAYSWSSCFKVRRRVEGKGGIKRVFAIVILFTHVSCVRRFSTLFPWYFLGGGKGGHAPFTALSREGGDVFQASISTVKRFPFHFFWVQFSFFFLLLVSCFYTLKLFQIVVEKVGER